MISDTEPPARQRSGIPVLFSSPRPASRAAHDGMAEGNEPRVTVWAGGGTARLASAAASGLTSVGIDVISTHASRRH